MRTFVVFCLIAVAAAQYDYTPETGATIGGNVYSGDGTVLKGSDYSNVGTITNIPVGAANTFSGSDYTSSNSPSAGAIQSVGPGQLQDNYQQTSAPLATEYQKEFFTYSSPDTEFDDDKALEKIASSLKKNLRVVFIKGPENTGLENAALQLAKSAADQRTAIYVLNKQADISELANKLNNLNQNGNSKPEVHFVKYRTQADAENAQRNIQAQYDTLPGSSSSLNGGIANVLNFASKGFIPTLSSPSSSSVGSGIIDSSASSNLMSGSIGSGSISNSFIAPQSSYLPPGRNH